MFKLLGPEGTPFGMSTQNVALDDVFVHPDSHQLCNSVEP
jgi:hypothetical protein